MRIYLVGFMGSGKSTLGRALAEEFDWDFVDLDREIERRAGMSIPSIFETFGEMGFRQREQTSLEETSHRIRTVLATGGGAFTRQENIDLIAKSGVSVWLNPSFDVVLKRLEKSVRERPLFQDPRQLLALYESRLPWYEQANLRIDIVTEDDAVTVTGKIVESLKVAPCVT